MCIPSMVIVSKTAGDVEDLRDSLNDLSKSKGTLLSKLMPASTKHGINDMVEEILEKFPNVASFDENGRNILHIVALLKDRIIYDHLKKTINYADRMMADVDNHGNTILHLAAYKYKKDHFPRNLFGPGDPKNVESALVWSPHYDYGEMVTLVSGIPSMVIVSKTASDMEDLRDSVNDLSKSKGTLLSKLMPEGSSETLILATKHGINDMVEEILEKFPNVASFDENGRNILHIVAQLKDRIIYDHLKKTVNHADRMMTDVDNHGNTILHLAAYKYEKDLFPQNLFGPVNLMTWDVLSIQNDSHPHLIYHRNIDGKTTNQVFKEEHGDAMKEAERAIKDINSCLMLVFTITGTVNYAALFTIPGGFDQ
ncbi:unnamed protein product [Camellia sinensis]